jgi:hypothetical protein
MDSGEGLPRAYTREELLGYLEHCRQKCQEIIRAMSNEQAYRVGAFPWGELPFAELQLYNLRHVQEHGAQLRMFLRQQAGQSTAREPRANEYFYKLVERGRHQGLYLANRIGYPCTHE